MKTNEKVKSESILTKVKNLLAKAESLKKINSVLEAELFLTKANELMLEYNIEQSELADKKHEGIIEVEGIPYGEVPSEGKWERDLMSKLCFYNFCTYYYIGGEDFVSAKKYNYKVKLVIVGKQANVEVIEYLFIQLRERFRAIALITYDKELKKQRNIYKISARSKESAADVFNNVLAIPRVNFTENDVMPESYAINMVGKIQHYYIKNIEKIGFASRVVYLKSFLLGTIRGIGYKLKEERDKFTTNHEGADSKLNALVLVTNEAIQAYYKEKYPNMKKHKTESVTLDASAYKTGVKVGYSININKPLGQSNSLNQKLI